MKPPRPVGAGATTRVLALLCCTTVDVSGATAGSKDFNDTMKSRLPLVLGFVLGAAFLLLLVTFRSLVIPIKRSCSTCCRWAPATAC